VHRLNVVSVIVPPSAAHAAGTDVVGDHIAAISEFLVANAADAVLIRNLTIEQLAHLAVGAQLAVSAGMLGIVDAADTHLALASFLWDCLPATAGEGAVDWAELVLAEAHGILLVGRKAIAGFFRDFVD
jgi:hypothetical protein